LRPSLTAVSMSAREATPSSMILAPSTNSAATARVVTKPCRSSTVTTLLPQRSATALAVAALLVEGARIMEEGVASLADIDTAVRLGLNHPMGPLELADYIGLDTVLYIADSLTAAYGERFRAPQTLRKLVEAGRLGRKSGGGFYDYDEAGTRLPTH